MKNRAFIILIIFVVMPFLFSQGMNINLFGAEGGQPYSYYADEIVVKSFPSAERIPEEDDFIGSISQLKLNGNAWIHFEQDNVTIHAQKITYSSESQSIVALDNVSIIQTDQNDLEKVTLKANSQMATFFIQDTRLIMEGNPEIVMGENTIKGERITFFEDEHGNQYMNVHSGPGQRAHGSYSPIKKQVSENQPESEPTPPYTEESQKEKSESLSHE